MSGSVEPAKRPRVGTQSSANSNSIRAKLNEQLTRLQSKHNAEIELLEDIKSFARQRSVIEKQYSESLHRLTTQYANKRETLPSPELPGFSRTENRGVVEVWKILIEKTEELSKRRQSMADLLLSQISEEMKNQKRVKENAFKRLIEIAQKMNSEIIESMKEVTTTKKSYGELEKVCEDARSKFTDAETKLRKKDVKFFGSIADLERKHKKASDRLKSCQKRTTVSRNDYLLSLETTNAHLKRHTEKDLPQLMLALDGETYDKIRNGYLLYAQLEADSANYIKAEFEDLREQAYLVSREFMLECYLHKHPVLRTPIQYTFEPYGQDTVTGISRDHGAEIFLDKDARKWAMKLIKDQEAVVSLQKQVKGLQSVTTAYTKNPEFGTADAQMEAQQKIDANLEDVRQMEVHVNKAEARLDALRVAGMDVSKWLQKAGEKNGGENSLSIGGSITPYRLSQLSLPMLGGSQEFDVETSSIQSGQMGGEFDSVSIGSARSDAFPKKCTALYNYTAQRPDELNITQDEELEVLEWDDGDGWCKGRNKSGKEGYFPQSYVQPSSRSSSPHSVLGQHQNNEASVSTVNTVESITTPTSNVAKLCMLRAIYEYTAQFEEELSFPEGAMIRLLRTDDNGVDDGWWEGSYEGKVGVFPSVVVEMLSDGIATPPNLHDVTPIVSEMGSAPPLESPPLPPSSPPPPIAPEDLGIGAMGPNPVAFKDSGFYNYNGSLPQTSSPNRSYSTTQSYTPSLRVMAATPDVEDREDNRTWRIDSFDDFGDDDESIL